MKLLWLVKHVKIICNVGSGSGSGIRHSNSGEN